MKSGRKGKDGGDTDCSVQAGDADQQGVLPEPRGMMQSFLMEEIITPHGAQALEQGLQYPKPPDSNWRGFNDHPHPMQSHTSQVQTLDLPYWGYF